MKPKLSIFGKFANALYPHEIALILNNHQIEDEDNLSIIQRIAYNSKHPDTRKPFDPYIDKRKYSYVKKWIENKLKAMDVDFYFDWITNLEKKIMTDSISPEEEKSLLKHLKTVSPHHYHFTRLYETIQRFRDYLLIRMRIFYYNPVSEFLDTYKTQYREAAVIHNDLNDATFDIINQHAYEKTESKQWAERLIKVFRNKDLDAYTRYRAVVRLMYIYYNYREATALKKITEELNEVLYQPAFYSKRILANYYANRSMMHQKMMELEQAEKYGYLSIRQQNNDYIFYLNNLCGVLIKRKKFQEALKLMQKAFSYLKKSNSMFNRIGFVALYVKVLVFNEKNKEATSYAETFRDNHKKEIFQYRWHLFYEAYLLSLLRQEKYRKIISVIQRNNLINLEEKAFSKTDLLAVLKSFYLTAAYLETKISEKRLNDGLQQIFGKTVHDISLKYKRKELIEELEHHVPQTIRSLKLK